MKKKTPKNLLYAIRICRKREKRRLRNPGRYKGGFHQSNFIKSIRGMIFGHLDDSFKGENSTSIKDGIATIRIPPVFSFLDNPKETLDVIYGIYKLSRSDDCNGINFDHSKCRKLDLGASIALDLIVGKLVQFWKVTKKNYHMGGTLPNSIPVACTIIGNGLLKHLKIKSHELTEEEKQKHIYLGLISGHQETFSLVKSSCQEITTQKIINYFDECLKIEGFEIKPIGKKYLGSWVGEVIDNAQTHSGRPNDWHIIAQMDRYSDTNECQLAVVNFGKSIYESISAPENHEGLHTRIKELTRRQDSFWSKLNNKDKENIWTLCALQDGVTRFYGTEEGFDRGSGTLKFIEFINNFHSHNYGDDEKMVLLSGSSRIVFDNKYKLQDKQIGNETRKVIAFNKNNCLSESPDKEYVHSIDGHFPGTVLSARFFIERDYLTKEIK